MDRPSSLLVKVTRADRSDRCGTQDSGPSYGEHLFGFTDGSDIGSTGEREFKNEKYFAHRKGSGRVYRRPTGFPRLSTFRFGAEPLALPAPSIW